MRSVLLISIALISCKNKEPDASGPPKPVTLDKFGLQLDLPGKVRHIAPHLDDDTLSITGKEFGEIFVGLEKTPTTLEKLQQDATRSNFKSETLGDGFAATYDYTMGSTKASSVAVHRTIGGKPFSCAANSTDKAWLDAAMAACKSLRPAT
jgi:hypothetical protein